MGRGRGHVDRGGCTRGRGARNDFAYSGGRGKTVLVGDGVAIVMFSQVELRLRLLMLLSQV